MLFATLHIRSDDIAVLPAGFSSSDAQWKFADDHEYRKARRERMHAQLGTTPTPVPRYHWQICSDGAIAKSDPVQHIKWLLSFLNPGVNLHDLTAQAFDYWFAFAWSGNGTGGGPSIDEELAQLLIEHKVRLDLGFYYEDEGSSS